MTPQENQTSALVQQPSTISDSSSPVPQTSALAEAFARQQSQTNVPTPSENIEEEELSETEVADSTDEYTLFFDQSGVSAGSLDGLNRSFIRTTPSMSPPPGTTGYTPPASLPDFNQLNRSTNTLPTQPATGFNSRTPSVNVPDRSQVLPPAQNSVVTPLETPGFDNSSQTNPNQPRNAWESFWD